MTPDTILRWHPQLIARTWTFSPLILRMATEDPGWGYTRIQGALKNLGHGVARSTTRTVGSKLVNRADGIKGV